MNLCSNYREGEEFTIAEIPVIQGCCADSPNGDNEVLHYACGTVECPNYKEFNYEVINER